MASGRSHQTTAPRTPPRPHRDVLPGRVCRDVAHELGVPEGTVRSRLFYALRSLRLVLDEMGWDQ